jgi:hypothetical protein
MISTGLTRILLTVYLVGSMTVSVASPGFSRSRSCARFEPVEPESDSRQAGEALDSKVWLVGGDATKESPLQIDVELDANLWVDNVPLVEDTEFVNLQVSGAPRPGQRLNAKLLWDSPRQLNDLDLFLYDSRGKQRRMSLRPAGQSRSIESVSVPAGSCDGFSVEVRGYRWLETTNATLSIWLSKPRADHYTCNC